MGSVIDATILHHVCVVLISLWLLNCYNYCHPVAYLISLVYLYLVHEGYVLKLRRKLQFEEKRDANQKRVLLDSETVRWLNHALEKMWLVCMEEIVSQKILLPIAPWFLKKYKPWTAKDIEIQQFYLGRSPPMFTEIRVLQNSNSDDHLVFEIGMNFRTADDMSAILGVKLRKRLGFGMWAKLHLLGMHIEGKVLVAVKFLRSWPFIGRLRVCFASPPFFQMTVKPVFPHGLDVTEVPGISGWIDNLLALVFEQTLVEPNMMVVDVEKFVSPQQGENWFSVDAKEPVAHAIVEVLEGAEMKPSDLNGLADPYVKGKLGPFGFRTKTKKKTLAPKWLEEFKIPICSWDSRNILHFEVRDKDHVFDDMMGDCCVNINELRDGQRHDIWLPLQNIKMGRLHIAVTVFEANGKSAEPLCSKEGPQSNRKRVSFEVDPVLACLDAETAQKLLEDISQNDSLSPRFSKTSPKIADKFEPVDIEGQSDTGIWIQQPGSEVVQVWEPRKGKRRDSLTSQVKGMACENDGSSSDESMEAIEHRSKQRVRRGLKKIGSMFQRDKGLHCEDKSSTSDSSPKAYVREINAKKAGVQLIIDNTHVLKSPVSPKCESESLDENELPSPHGNVKHMAKSILKQAGKSARELRSVLSRKQSTKPMSMADASNDETSSSSTPKEQDNEESGLLIHGSVVHSPSSVSGSKSFKSKDDAIQKTSLSESSSCKNDVHSADNTTQD